MNNYQALNISATDGQAMPNKAKYFVHPLFGIQYIDTDDQNRVVQGPQQLHDEYMDFVPRELGISREVVSNNRLLYGLARPADYLQAKNANLHAIGQTLAQIYKEQYIKYVNYGYAISEARRAALKFAENMRESYLHEHELNFPTEVTKRATFKLENRAHLL